jgi:hypothetical protein
MERKDEMQPDKQQPDMPQTDEERESMAKPGEREKGKPDEERDNTVGKVPDPQGEDEQRDRDKA